MNPSFLTKTIGARPKAFAKKVVTLAHDFFCTNDVGENAFDTMKRKHGAPLKEKRPYLKSLVRS